MKTDSARRGAWLKEWAVCEKAACEIRSFSARQTTHHRGVVNAQWVRESPECDTDCDSANGPCGTAFDTAVKPASCLQRQRLRIRLGQLACVRTRPESTRGFRRKPSAAGRSLLRDDVVISILRVIDLGVLPEMAEGPRSPQCCARLSPANVHPDSKGRHANCEVATPVACRRPRPRQARQRTGTVAP